MKIDKIDVSQLGYGVGVIYFPFSIDIPDYKYWSYSETDKNYTILIEAVLKFKEIYEKQQESIEKKKKIINSFYAYSNSNVPDYIYDAAVDAYRNYITTGSPRARALNDFVTVWKDDTESTENNLETKEEKEETNEVTAFTSGEISW